MSKFPWQQAPLPKNEVARLAELSDYRILDTQPEVVFDRLTRLAAHRFAMPIALVSLVDEKRQWFKSRYGLDVSETPRELAFCAHAILGDDVFVVPDAAEDPRFAGNPLVADDPAIRFYAGAPLKSSNGHRLGTICVIDRVPHLDFSDAMRADLAELASIVIDEMELRLAAATAQQRIKDLRLAQQALEDARRTTERMMDEKSQFIATISHELRTPMNGILGMAHLLGNTPLNKTQQEYIDTINHSAQNLLLLINDVLDMSKIEAGGLKLENKPFNVKSDYMQTLKLLQPLADKKGTTLTCQVDPRVPDAIISDPGRFAQIVTNLVGNAVKFTENGRVEAGLMYDEDANSIYCEIVDTGIGIPVSKQSSIFEKFTQGDPGITQKYGGTGLGLAITKRLVVMMGGTIGFTSQEGVGSCFWFTLPVVKPDLDIDLVEIKAEIPQPSGRLDVAAARVLIAEDHPVNQMFLIEVLKSMGFAQIDVAINGLEVSAKVGPALAAKKPVPYDIILMDCRMPERDGYEATRHIRAGENATMVERRVPIIAMTANALVGDREGCLEAGMDDYLAKPLQPERLGELLRKWFVFPAEKKREGGIIHITNGAPPMDMARLEMIAKTPADKTKFMDMFNRMASGVLATMVDAVCHPGNSPWSNAAHSLKGAAANLGMSNLEAICRRCEAASVLSDAQRAAFLDSLHEELSRIRMFVADQHIVPPDNRR